MSLRRRARRQEPQGICRVSCLVSFEHLQNREFDNEHIVNASYCGDNCAQWILRIAEKKDLTIRLGYLMDFGSKSIKARVANSGKIFDNCKDLFLEAIEYL